MDRSVLGNGTTSDGSSEAAMICFSHLRWGHVWQRPQHLMTRFANRLPVFFVEEPEFVTGGAAGTVRVEHDHGVTILTPLLEFALLRPGGFNDVTKPRIAALLAPIFIEAGLLPSDHSAALERPLILWYYTPMALRAEPASLRPALTIFDAMDELANFAQAPAGLVRRETELMARADLVFTGGPSLYAARRDRHPRVFCHPSGVDAAHFAPRPAVGITPADVPTDGSPIIGFYGVIDERLDTALLAALADARPGWTVLMIGPVVKIAPSELPRRPNLQYLGARSYRDLPAYLAAFDVAILPFARNAATRFISPTKTLEYLAAEKPVVSTPIQDVVDLYGDVVRIAATPTAFVAAIEAALSESASERTGRRTTAARLLAEQSWDAIAGRMWHEMTSLLPATLADASRLG